MNDLRRVLQSKCFVDTNIWLYSFIESQGQEKSRQSQSILAGDDIYLSTQVINEMCVNLINKAQFTEPQIQELLHSLYKKYTIIELSKEILATASQVRSEFQFSYWDSIIVASAIDCEADYLLTEDMHDGFAFTEGLTIIIPL